MPAQRHFGLSRKLACFDFEHNAEVGGTFCGIPIHHTASRVTELVTSAIENDSLQHHIKWSNARDLANICGMSKKTLAIFPTALKQLGDLGERLRLARRRRLIGTELFAERMGVSRETLRRLEKGDPTIAMGTYLRALRVLGLDSDIDAVGRDDVLGRKLQDIALLNSKRKTV